MRRRRVAILVPKLFGGGAERVASELSLGLDAERHVVLFEPKIEYPHGGTLHLLGVPDRARLGPLGKVKKLGRALTEARRVKRRIEVDTALSLLPIPNVVNVLSRQGERVVISTRTTPSRDNPTGLMGFVYRSLMRSLYPRADRIIAISKSVRDELIQDLGAPPERTVVIYNPIPLERLRADASAPPTSPLDALLSDGRPAVVSVGRLMPEKGHLWLVRAFARLDREPRPRLILLGRGPLANQVVATGRRRGLKVWSHLEEGAPDGAPEACDLVLPGFLKNPHAVMSRAAIFAFPSLYEGLGQALLEALACEVPIVAADCRSGPREILAPDTPHTRITRTAEETPYGLLMPPFETTLPSERSEPSLAEEAWTHALDTLLADELRRAKLAHAGRARAADFDLDRIMPQWERALFEWAD